MEFFILILLLCFIIFLFYLHIAAKEDFVLIRKNITLEHLFDISFLTGFAALFGARLFYVLLNPSLQYLNPLVFFGLPYFPGLSVSGGLIGGCIFLLLYGRRNRLPASRIADFFSVAFLLSIPVGFVAAAFLGEKGNAVLFYTAAILTLLLFLLFARLLFPKLLGGQYKDGTITYLFLMNFPLVFLLSQIISRASLRQFYFIPEDGIMLAIFLIGFVLYLKQEHISQRRKALK